MKQTKDLKELEGKIGYTFKDKTLFKQALTHSSYANEHRHEGLKDNERLSFLAMRLWRSSAVSIYFTITRIWLRAK